jgi:hypothetical protein
VQLVAARTPGTPAPKIASRIPAPEKPALKRLALIQQQPATIKTSRPGRQPPKGTDQALTAAEPSIAEQQFSPGESAGHTSGAQPASYLTGSPLRALTGAQVLRSCCRAADTLPGRLVLQTLRLAQ